MPSHDSLFRKLQNTAAPRVHAFAQAGRIIVVPAGARSSTGGGEQLLVVSGATLLEAVFTAHEQAPENPQAPACCAAEVHSHLSCPGVTTGMRGSVLPRSSASGTVGASSLPAAPTSSLSA